MLFRCMCLFVNFVTHLTNDCCTVNVVTCCFLLPVASLLKFFFVSKRLLGMCLKMILKCYHVYQAGKIFCVLPIFVWGWVCEWMSVCMSVCVCLSKWSTRVRRCKTFWRFKQKQGNFRAGEKRALNMGKDVSKMSQKDVSKGCGRW